MPPGEEKKFQDLGKKSPVPLKVKALGVFMCAALVCSVMAAISSHWGEAAIALAILTHSQCLD